MASALAVTGAATPSPAQALYALLAGLAELGGFAALYRGLAIGCMGLVAPISAAAAVIPLAVGVAAHGERLGASEAVAVAVVICGVALAACEPVRRARGARVATGAGLGVVAALGFGLFFAGMGAAASGGALAAVALNRATAVVVLLAALAAARPRLERFGAHDLGPLAAVGALDAVANVLFAVALTRGATGVVSVLGSLYPVTTVLLARAVLRERTTLAQRAGATACLAGVAALAAHAA